MQTKKSILYKIVGIYLLFSIVWVGLGDFILFNQIPAELDLSFSLLKGWLFVFLSALLLYFLLKHYIFELQLVERDLDHTQKSLHEASKHLSFMIDNLPIVLWRLDTEGRVQQLYGSGIKDLLHKPEEILNANIFESFSDYPDVAKYAKQALDGQYQVWQMTVGQRVYDCVYQPIWEDEEVAGAIGLAVNVTRLEQIKEDLQHTRSELQVVRQSLLALQRIELLGTAVSNLTHELNNQFTAIIGYLNLALRDIDDPPESLIIANQLAQNSAKLPEHLLAFSRSKGKGSETSDIRQVIDNIDPIIKQVIGNDIDLSVDIAPGVEDLNISSIRLESILTNLVTNASDAIEGRGNIVIQADQVDDPIARDGQLSGEYVRIMVEDTGTGIDPDIAPHVFDPLFTTKTEGKGTGLGLFIVKEVTTSIGGGIHLESNQTGTTVSIFIPTEVREKQEKMVQLPDDKFTEVSRNLESVLVVDNNDHILDLIKAILTNVDTITTYRDLDEAVHTLSSGHQLDLLIIDEGITDLPRSDFLLQLRSIRPDLSILMTSGYTELPHEVDSLDNVWYLSKPFTPGQLLTKISQIATIIE